MSCIAKTGECIKYPLVTITDFPASLATANYCISDDKVSVLDAFNQKNDNGNIKSIIIRQALATTADTLNTGGIKVHLFDDNTALSLSAGDAVALGSQYSNVIDTIVCESSEWVVQDATHAILSKDIDTDVWSPTNLTEIPILLASNDVSFALPVTAELTVQLIVRQN